MSAKNFCKTVGLFYDSKDIVRVRDVEERCSQNLSFGRKNKN